MQAQKIQTQLISRRHRSAICALCDDTESELKKKIRAERWWLIATILFSSIGAYVTYATLAKMLSPFAAGLAATAMQLMAAFGMHLIAFGGQREEKGVRTAGIVLAVASGLTLLGLAALRIFQIVDIGESVAAGIAAAVVLGVIEVVTGVIGWVHGRAAANSTEVREDLQVFQKTYNAACRLPGEEAKVIRDHAAQKLNEFRDSEKSRIGKAAKRQADQIRLADPDFAVLHVDARDGLNVPTYGDRTHSAESNFDDAPRAEAAESINTAASNGYYGKSLR